MSDPQERPLVLSSLPKTWILDLDGTIVRHNGYKDGGDEVLPEALRFLEGLDPDDMVVIITSRPGQCRDKTEAFLRQNGIRYDAIVWGAPFGERILVNDMKPSGLQTAYAVNCVRDGFAGVDYTIDGDL